MQVYINTMELVWDLFFLCLRFEERRSRPSKSLQCLYKLVERDDGLLISWDEDEARMLCVVVEPFHEFGFCTILESCSQGRRSSKCFETRGLPKAPIPWTLAPKHVSKRIHIRICRVRLSGIPIASMSMVLFFLFFLGLFAATFDRGSNYEG